MMSRNPKSKSQNETVAFVMLNRDSSESVMLNIFIAYVFGVSPMLIVHERGDSEGEKACTGKKKTKNVYSLLGKSCCSFTQVASQGREVELALAGRPDTETGHP